MSQQQQDFLATLFAEFKRISEEYLALRQQAEETRRQATEIGQHLQSELQQTQALLRAPRTIPSEESVWMTHPLFEHTAPTQG